MTKLVEHITSVREISATSNVTRKYQAFCTCGWTSSLMTYESEASLYAAGHRRAMKEKGPHNAL